MPRFKGKGHKPDHKTEGVSISHSKRVRGMGDIARAIYRKTQYIYTQSSCADYDVPFVPPGVVTMSMLVNQISHPSGNSEMFRGKYVTQAEPLEFSQVLIYGFGRGIFWKDEILGLC